MISSFGSSLINYENITKCCGINSLYCFCYTVLVFHNRTRLFPHSSMKWYTNQKRKKNWKNRNSLNCVWKLNDIAPDPNKNKTVDQSKIKDYGGIHKEMKKAMETFSLTHSNPMFHFYTPLKRQKTFDFQWVKKKSAESLAVSTVTPRG